MNIYEMLLTKYLNYSRILKTSKTVKIITSSNCFHHHTLKVNQIIMSLVKNSNKNSVGKSKLCMVVTFLKKS